MSGPQSWSLGEARALAVKAARGVGYPWGLAEEAGYALHWLAARSLPGAEALAELLDGGCTAERPCQACPLAMGARLADLQEVPEGPLTLRYPLLLAPFAARLAGPVIVRWQGVCLTLADDTRCDGAAGALLAAQAEVILCPGSGNGAALSPATRVPASAAPAIATLTRLAARTYAPATEASRLSGAGAGTTDND